MINDRGAFAWAATSHTSSAQSTLALIPYKSAYNLTLDLVKTTPTTSLNLSQKDHLLQKFKEVEDIKSQFLVLKVLYIYHHQPACKF